ncbi:MAG: M23 family metallopeptidase, partial [Pseudolabrys sp.]|nr:M23 family metallopeptidase [Pseudolabrys sp.]
NAGDRIKIPGGYAPQREVSAAPVAPPPQHVVAPPPVSAPPATQTARMATPEPVKPETQPSPVKSADATGALPSFRWPVKGRVITAFGAKTDGQQNDGINIAVPEGTPIKAAEDGVVAYAGNELKGYGNLVLVRHSNGYVSAYAHASELSVKRGDAIKRGQVIGRAGQTGNVTSPQLHFEIRKGSSPVDPTQFLGAQG